MDTCSRPVRMVNFNQFDAFVSILTSHNTYISSGFFSTPSYHNMWLKIRGTIEKSSGRMCYRIDLTAKWLRAQRIVKRAANARNNSGAKHKGKREQPCSRHKQDMARILVWRRISAQAKSESVHPQCLGWYCPWYLTMVSSRSMPLKLDWVKELRGTGSWSRERWRTLEKFERIKMCIRSGCRPAA